MVNVSPQRVGLHRRQALRKAEASVKLERNSNRAGLRDEAALATPVCCSQLLAEPLRKVVLRSDGLPSVAVQVAPFSPLFEPAQSLAEVVHIFVYRSRKRLSVLIDESPCLVRRNRREPLMKRTSIVKCRRDHERAARVYKSSFRAPCRRNPGWRQSLAEVPAKLELGGDYNLALVVDISVLAVHLDHSQINCLLRYGSMQESDKYQDENQYVPAHRSPTS